MTRDPGGFRAQWPGVCGICHQPFPKNEPIVKKRGEPCHVACYSEEHE